MITEELIQRNQILHIFTEIENLPVREVRIPQQL